MCTVARLFFRKPLPHHLDAFVRRRCRQLVNTAIGVGFALNKGDAVNIDLDNYLKSLSNQSFYRGFV